MRYVIQYIFITLASISIIKAGPIAPIQKSLDQLSVQKSISESAWKKVLKNNIYVSTNVKDFKYKSQKYQKLSFKMAGLHQKSCRFSLRKLSHYESYSKHLGFIKHSSYDEKSERVNFLLSSKLLPYNMRLNFSIPRIKTVGVYPFFFDQGFLKGLKGNIVATNYKKRCLFYVQADWSGPHSGIPNTLFEFFSKALARLSMENLFRISSTY